ncbi:hypothetical protein IC582_017180 [Cucumis melo]
MAIYGCFKGKKVKLLADFRYIALRHSTFDHFLHCSSMNFWMYRCMFPRQVRMVFDIDLHIEIRLQFIIVFFCGNTRYLDLLCCFLFLGNAGIGRGFSLFLEKGYSSLMLKRQVMTGLDGKRKTLGHVEF